jgi:TolB-like protein/Flp pilus assembly protein TadD
MSGGSPVAGDATQSNGPREGEHPPLSKDVFVSYASQDASVANSLVEALERRDFRCWIAPRDVTPGDFYADAIVHAIDAAQALVLVLSKDAAVSHHILREVERASSKRHPVISLRIDRAPLPAGLEYFLNTSQWLDASEGVPSRAFPKLVEAVRKVVAGKLATADGNAIPPQSVGSKRVPSRPLAVALGMVVVAISGFAIDRWWVSRRIAWQAPMAAAVAPTVAVSTPAIPEKSVAVLPFVDMSEKKDQEYFSDGLAEELIDQLAKNPGLKVIARTSSFSFKGKSDDIPTIAAKLKVANVLEGSVRRSGDHLRVSTQLVRADSGEQLWSETYDRDFKDVFTVQDDIATAVVAALKLKLVGGSTTEAHGTTNTEAYAAYLLGQQLYRQSTAASNRRALDSYNKAISLDPRYARAYAELARAQYRLGDIEADASLMHAARESAQKAIDLDPRLGLGYAMRSFLRSASFDWTGAEADARQALTLDPTDPSVLSNYARLCYRLGRLPEAISMYRKALERDPLAHVSWQGLGLVLVALHDYPAAYDAYGRALAENPSSMYNKYGLASLQLSDGKALQALSTYQTIDFEPFRDTGVAMAEHSLGEAKASQTALDALIASSAGIDSYQIAEVYAWRGEKDLAFEWLERAYRQQDGGLTDIKIDSYVASLHSDPRYAAFLRKLNFPP